MLANATLYVMFVIVLLVLLIIFEGKFQEIQWWRNCQDSERTEQWGK